MGKAILMQGWDAIKMAEKHGLRLSKYNDPLEGPQDGLTVEEAKEVAREDQGLIYLQCPNCGNVLTLVDDYMRKCLGCGVKVTPFLLCGMCFTWTAPWHEC